MSGRAVEGMPEMVAYLKPSHARPERPPLIIKRLANPRGVVPPQLIPYVESLKATKAKLKNKEKEE